MIGACIIDGIDIATLGVLILQGGDTGFISFPARKEPTLIEWPDVDGFEIGDDAAVFKAKELTVNYYLKGDETTFLPRLNAFADLHFVAANNLIYVREFARTFTLRFAGISALKINRGLTRTGEKSARISIDYVMDDPTQFLNTAITAATALRPSATKVEVDGIDLADYGIIVKDIYSTALQVAGKSGIVYNSNYATGQTVTFPSALKKEKQTIDIFCAMICADRTTYLSNWSALFNAITASSVTIGLTAAGKTYKAYYSTMSAMSKRPWTNRAKAEFKLEFYGFEV